VNDEFRVEVELDDEEHGYSLGKRLRALDLDDEARKRLGRGVMVTRDGSRMFLYAASEAQAREAERVVQILLDAEELTAETAVTRWHPVEQDWKDASIPLPSTPDEERAEYSSRETAEAREADVHGEYDWHVVVHLEERDRAVDLAERLSAEGMPVAQRWRYVVVGTLTEEQAEEIAQRLRADLPEGDVSVKVNLDHLRLPPLLFLPF
jgi:hypothetical protein